MQLTTGEYAISKEAPLLRVWPKTFPVRTEGGRRADACQLSLSEQLALRIPIMTKQQRRMTLEMLHFSGTNQFPASAFGLQCCMWLLCDGRGT